MNHALARQMLGQRPARRLAPGKALHRHRLRIGWPGHIHRGLGLRAIFLELEQLQLQLVEQRAALRRLAEPLVPQPGDRKLQLLDLERTRLGFVLRRRGARLRGP